MVKKYFAKFKKPLIDFPNLIEFQQNSFKWFYQKGLKELFEEISPIKDFTEKELELSFVDYTIGKSSYDDYYAKDHNLSYEAPLRVKVSLLDKKTKKRKEQEVFFGNIFLMTSRGTFVINGVERVIVSQLARSFGVYFNAVTFRGKDYFGAKIIPSRGSWLEIQTEPNGVIYAKIDRKRKFPITSLMRFFGLEKDEEIKKTFEDVDRGNISYIEETLKEDQAKNQNEGALEVYGRIRPGEPVTADVAKEFLRRMFSRERYDLSLSGRYRLNRRLGLSLDEIEKVSRTLNIDDLKVIIKKIIELNNTPGAKPDDIDHLGNRRVRGVGEMFQQRLRLALIRMRAIIQDRMSTLERESLAPVQLVNPRPFMIVMREFFLTGQLSQFMNQENILSEVEHLRRLSALGPGGLSRERAGIEARDVHSSHYNRICPIQTPEGQNVGLVISLATFARVNEFGILETPYLKVEKGRITYEVRYLDAFEEQNYNIAAASTRYDEKGRILEDLVEARIKGQPSVVRREDINFIDVSPQQTFSVSAGLIPFLEHDDATRALMGANMQRQAVPCLKPEIPLVATGLEKKVAIDSGRLILAEEDGLVKYVDAQKIILETKKKEIVHNLLNFHRSNDFTLIHQRPVVSPGQKLKKGEVLTNCASTEQGELALGKNVLVAFLSLAGATYEDSIVISERLVRDDVYTSIHIEEHTSDVRDTKLGPEITTYDIPNVSEERLKNLDEEGIVRIGAEVRTNDILIGKLSPKGEIELTPEEKLLRAIFGEKAKQFKDTSYRLPHGKEGRVIGVKIFSRDKGDKLEPGIIKRIQIEVAQLRKIEIGDKLSGRHGNKGVVSKILKTEDMPFLEDGRPVDIVLNPLGVISRMNLGQILETHLGLAAKTLNYQAISPIFQGSSEEEIKEELKKAGYPSSGQLKLYDGRSGKLIERQVTVGYIYMLKLKHMVSEKIHMRSIGPYSLITQQPLGGKAQMGGQRFGEMEVWALEAYGAAHALQEMLTIKSDDVAGRIAVHEAIIRGEKFKNPSLPASFNVLLNELRGLALEVKLFKKNNSYMNDRDNLSLFIKLASPEEIIAWSHGEVTKPETINYRTQRAEKDGLFDEKIFGPEKDYHCFCGKYRKIRFKGIICDKCGVEVTRSIVRRERLGHINLASPVAHIWFLRSSPSRLGSIFGIPLLDLEKVIYFNSFIIIKVNQGTKEELEKELEKEYQRKFKSLKTKKEKEILKASFSKTKQELTDIKAGKILTSQEHHFLSLKYGKIFESGIGAEALYNLAKEIDLEKTKNELEKELKTNLVEEQKLQRRLKLFKSIIKAKIRPEWMFLKALPVIPPELRPIVQLDGGRHASADVNDLYRRVINRNNRLKYLLEINAPEIIIRNEKRMLQEAVDALIDNSMRRTQAAAISKAQKRPLRSLADMLKGKQGRFRRNLLGKRVDYSARSVIVVGPELKLEECGLPKYMCLEIYRPFVISKLIQKGHAYNIRGANRLIDEARDEVWEVLEELIKDSYVLLNRAPTLHRLSIQAFKPILVEGNAIQIHPLICTGFNADFDGDQMAVHLPLSNESQTESRDLIASVNNLTKPGTGEPVVSPEQDIVLGCYWLTDIYEGAKGEGKVFSDFTSSYAAYEKGLLSIQAKIKIRIKNELIETSLGRLIFNRVLPENFGFINQQVKKQTLSEITKKIINYSGKETAASVLDKIKNLGFHYATLSGVSFSIDDIRVPEEKPMIIEEAKRGVEKIEENYKKGLLSFHERFDALIETWQGASQKINSLVPSSLDRHGSIHQMVGSAARGNWPQVYQLAGIKGLVLNPAGRIIELPAIASYKEGLKVLEYFISTHGARKGTADTALKTSVAGYLTRKLVDAVQAVIILEKDCKDSQGFLVRRQELENYGRKLKDRIFGRFLAKDLVDKKRKVLFKKGHLISFDDAELIDGLGVEELVIRSPLTCKTLRGLCQTCYGYDLGKNSLVDLGEAAGVIAAQSIGEPGTQLTMRTFHYGGVVLQEDITLGLPQIVEIFETQIPSDPAIISEEEGTIEEIEERAQEKVIKIRLLTKGRKKETIKEHIVPLNKVILVKKGDKIKPGDRLSGGIINIRQLHKLAGQEKTQRYILNELERIYLSQNAPINEKHIEVVVRQMFSRIKIIDRAGTRFTKGEIVEEADLYEENEEAKKQNKNQAKGAKIVLGITKVALTAPGFLSAASFQETARIFINAALERKEDKLVGLKENVIIGRLIPVGTGFKKEYIKEKEKAEKKEEKKIEAKEK